MIPGIKDFRKRLVEGQKKADEAPAADEEEEAPAAE